MAVRVAINGFGHIGRNVLRAILESGRKDIEVATINDLGPVETNAHLLRFDSVHGRFPHEVKVDGDSIDVGRGKMKVTAERDPSKLPHKAMGVDIALECTGFFTSKKAASAHIDAERRMREFGGISDGRDFDRAGADIDSVAINRHDARELAVHRVKAEKMRVGLDRAEIVDRDDLDILAAGLVDGAQDVAADASEPVDGNLHRHGVNPSMNRAPTSRGP